MFLWGYGAKRCFRARHGAARRGIRSEARRGGRGWRLSRLEAEGRLLCHLSLRCLVLCVLLRLCLGLLRSLQCIVLRRDALLLLLMSETLLFQELLLAGDLLLSLARGDSQARFSRGALGSNAVLPVLLHVSRLSGLLGAFALVSSVRLSGLLEGCLLQGGFRGRRLFSLSGSHCVVTGTLLRLSEALRQSAGVWRRGTPCNSGCCVGLDMLLCREAALLRQPLLWGACRS